MTCFVVKLTDGDTANVPGSGYLVLDDGTLVIAGRYLGMGESAELTRFKTGEWEDIRPTRGERCE